MNTAMLIASSMQTNKITTDHKDFYVSYQPSSADYGCPTTALYINSTSQFLILNGRHEFANCISLQDHVDYFYNHVGHANPRSEHGTVFECSENGAASYQPGGY